MPKYTTVQYLQWYFGIAVESPVFQLLSIFMAVVAAQKTSPYAFLLRNSHAVKVAVGLVCGIQLWQRWQLQDKQFKQFMKALKAVENTSQVCATRANVIEWRSCLQLLSQWHRLSLQSAYKLWQLKLGSVPPCPANQWGVLSSGTPMAHSDQSIADTEFPQYKVEWCKVDQMVSNYGENKSLLDSGAQFDDAESLMNSLKKFAAPVEQWKSTRMETAIECEEAVQQFMQNIDAQNRVWR